MNIKETIRAKIERMLEFDKDVKTNYYIGRRDAEMEILALFDTLPEQPVEGVEEEIKRYYADNFDYISSEQPTLSILTNIARHFAEWGAKHLKR